MDDDAQRQARSFGTVAAAYDRGRPTFPLEAARWLAGSEPTTLLELGAGTGKLTTQLVALGHDVHATEPDAAMLAVLREALPDVPTSESPAEEIPLPDRSVDVVVAAQAFHWFDHDRALPEIARVLRPGGHLAIAWNIRDERIPWVRRLGALLGSPGAASESTNFSDVLVRSDLFGFVEEKGFPFWQEVNRHTIVDMAASRSYVATLDEEARAARLAEVRAFYDDFGRGMDGMQLPYRCECYRAKVVDRPDREPPDRDDDTSDPAGPSTPERSGSGRRVSDGGDPDLLLIDFR
jgi:SAM-dependent methyltransferase